MDASSNRIKELLNAVGALGELCGVLRDELIRNGFTRQEACMIISQVLAETFNPKKK